MLYGKNKDELEKDDGKYLSWSVNSPNHTVICFPSRLMASTSVMRDGICTFPFAISTVTSYTRKLLLGRVKTEDPK